MKTLVERLETPVREETDVLVVGGGIAGDQRAHQLV